MNIDKELEIALYHLIWVWYQYGGGYLMENGIVALPHQCAQAGEGACDFLVKYGLAIDQGWQAELTEKGMLLLKKDL